MKALIAIIALVIVASVVGATTYRNVTASSEPHLSMVGGDIVYIRHRERTYTARYESGQRAFEVLYDHRFGRRCKPRVEVGATYALDYRCDRTGNTEKHPDIKRSVDDLIPQIINDFAAFRPMADGYYAKHVTGTR